MGHEAAVTKRKVLDAVKESIRLTNEGLAQVDKLNEAHNSLNEQVSKDFQSLGLETADLARRVKAQGVWCEQNEKALKDARTDFGQTVERLERQIAYLRQQQRLFHEMTMWQRLQWALRGRQPLPEELQERLNRQFAVGEPIP